MFACDLDRTLIHAVARIESAVPAVVIVEHHGGRPISAMTQRACALLCEVADALLFVPVTTRSREQAERVVLPVTPRWLICANGGIVLCGGARDHQWDEHIRAGMLERAPLAGVERACHSVAAGWLENIRLRDDLFISAGVTAPPPAAFTTVAHTLAESGWDAGVHGGKFYALPTHVTKLAAVQHVAQRHGCALTVAAGDSELDRGFVNAAPLRLVPRGSALASPGHRPAGVRVTAREHVLAAEDLLVAVLTSLSGVPASPAPMAGG